MNPLSIHRFRSEKFNKVRIYDGKLNARNLLKKKYQPSAGYRGYTAWRCNDFTRIFLIRQIDLFKKRKLYTHNIFSENFPIKQTN